MAYVQLNSERSINRLVSDLPEVQRAVEERADEIAAAAERNLAAHRKTGAAKITVDHSGTDSTVYLEDDNGHGAALSIEYGHVDPDSGEYVEGLYVLRRAAGLQ
jgi:hypothetical protein